jgi:hypothetical protein
MAWGWLNDKTEKEKSAPSSTDDLKAALKLQTLLENANNKFEEKYADLSLAVTIPALLQLIAQAKARKTGNETFNRDVMYEKAGKAPNPADLEDLDQALLYADWAYEKEEDVKNNLKASGFTLLKFVPNEDAGKVGYYIAHNPETKVGLIGVKGTDSAQDILTDCCAATATHKLERSFVADDNRGWFDLLLGSDIQSLTDIHCHEGILISAKWLAEELMPFVRDLYVPLDYQILVCGHSLGAGASGLVATLLRSQIPELIQRNSIQVKAFASPPILNREAAMACSSFVTTIVNNCDIIPRCSLNNVEVLLEVLVKVQKKLEEGGLNCKDFQSTKAYLEKLNEGTEGDMLMTPEEAFGVLTKAQETVILDDPDHLYVSGKVLLMFDKYQDRKKLKELEEEKEEKEKGKKKRKKKKKKELEDDEEEPKAPSFCVETDPITAALRIIELHKDMAFDHTTDAYIERVGAVLKKD